MSWEIIENMRFKVYLIRGLSFIEVLFRFATVGSRKDFGRQKTRNLASRLSLGPVLGCCYAGPSEGIGECFGRLTSAIFLS